MNPKQHRTAAGIAALIAGTLTIVPALDVGAANRPAPANNQRATPAVVGLPCPAADVEPQCDLRRSPTPDSAGAIRQPPSTAAAGGAGAVLSPGHLTPSPR